jgi:hypothetical protein
LKGDVTTTCNGMVSQFCTSPPGGKWSI